jgi:hypothetical protein
VTIVKSTEGYIFGGYSDQSWESDNQWKSLSRAFLFSIVNPAGLAPMKLPLTGKSNNKAVYCDPSYGPVFGWGGNDLCIRDKCKNVKYLYYISPLLSALMHCSARVTLVSVLHYWHGDW